MMNFAGWPDDIFYPGKHRAAGVGAAEDGGRRRRLSDTQTNLTMMDFVIKLTDFILKVRDCGFQGGITTTPQEVGGDVG